MPPLSVGTLGSIMPPAANLGDTASAFRDFIPPAWGEPRRWNFWIASPPPWPNPLPFTAQRKEVAEQLHRYHAAGLEHVVLSNVTFFADAYLVRYTVIDRVRRLLVEARVA